MTVLKFNGGIKNTMDEIVGSWRSVLGSLKTKRLLISLLTALTIGQDAKVVLSYKLPTNLVSFSHVKEGASNHFQSV